MNNRLLACNEWLSKRALTWLAFVRRGRSPAGLTSLNSLSSSGVYTTNTSSSLVASGVGGGGGGVGVGVGSGVGGFPNASPLPGSANLENAATEIDRIMAKIEQDNKILAELEKSRSTIGKICEI